MSEKQNTFNKSNRKRLISNIIFMAMATILVIVLFCSLGEISDISQTMRDVFTTHNGFWLIAALGCTLIYFLLWPLSLCVFAKGKANFKDSYFIGCSEHFYNGVTPFATGGQPFQIYSYSKRGVKASEATGIVLVNFVTFMIVTNLIAIVSLFFWPYFTSNLDSIKQSYGNIDLSWFKPVAIVGFVCNFLTLLFMICLGCSKTIRNGIIGIVKLFGKIKFLSKIISKSLPGLEEYCDNAQIAFKEITKDKVAFIKAFILKFITMVFYYAIPYFILLAIGIEITSLNFFVIFFGTSFAITAVVFMPTPGGTGGIEYAFAIVIASIASSFLGQAEAVSLLWRFFTYYLLMIISFVMSLIFENMLNKKEKIKEETPDEQE